MSGIKNIIRRIALAAFLVTAGSMAVAACSASGGDPVVETCQKLDECNALSAGTGVDTCVEEFDAQLRSLPASEQGDLETLLDSCLQFESCNAYLSCLN